MGLEDFVVIALLVLVVGAAVAYLVRARKRGVKCIGCPAGGTCGAAQKKSGTSGGCGCGCSGCASHTDKEK